MCELLDRDSVISSQNTGLDVVETFCRAVVVVVVAGDLDMLFLAGRRNLLRAAQTADRTDLGAAL
jgi:hypothetical protein